MKAARETRPRYNIMGAEGARPRRLKLSGIRIVAGQHSEYVKNGEDENRGYQAKKAVSYGNVLSFVCLHLK